MTTTPTTYRGVDMPTDIHTTNVGWQMLWKRGVDDARKTNLPKLDEVFAGPYKAILCDKYGFLINNVEALETDINDGESVQLYIGRLTALPAEGSTRAPGHYTSADRLLDFDTEKHADSAYDYDPEISEEDNDQHIANHIWKLYIVAQAIAEDLNKRFVESLLEH